jgi:DNA polymerase III alpha subunit
MFNNFNEWLCKTNFSFLHGASHPRDLIETANRLGYQSLSTVLTGLRAVIANSTTFGNRVSIAVSS